MDNDGYAKATLPHGLRKIARSQKPVTLLIGKDGHIGEAEGQPETRVAVTPNQLRHLRTSLADLDCPLQMYIVAGAGEKAGFSNEEYRTAGCQIVAEEDVDQIDPPPDVFASLKEVSEYEKHISGHALRLGALHLGAEIDENGDFNENGGLASRLRSENFSAIFDGSDVGGYAHKYRGGPEIPIRGSMSPIAGRWAGEKVLMRTPKAASGRVVIAGGGRVGSAAIEQLLAAPTEQVSHVMLVEECLDRWTDLAKIHADNPRVTVVRGSRLDPKWLVDAVGLILAPARPNEVAPPVTAINDVIGMRVGGTVIDVSSDEGGSIESNERRTAAPVPATRQAVAQAIETSGRSILYIADTHIPRYRPREASELHGQAMLPYLAVLLYLAAQHPGKEVVDFVLQVAEVSQPEDEFTAMVCDLAAGLKFRGPPPEPVGTIKNGEAIIRFLRKLREPSLESLSTAARGNK